MKEIKVVGVGRLKEYLSEGVTVAAGQTVCQAMESLNLAATGGLPITPMVNDRLVEWSYTLQPGDRLVLVPTIGGGCWISK
jgi:molybdopterin converting factor small subunit